MNKAINQALKRTAHKAHPKSQDDNTDITCCPNCGYEFPHESGTGQAAEDEGIGGTAMKPSKIWLQRNKQRRK